MGDVTNSTRNHQSSTSDEPAVELDNVTVSFGGEAALDGTSLTVSDGEFFTLVGPSGCGKTTTLRTVAGFETPTSGSICIAGEPTEGVPPEERNIGIVFQNYALFPNMTVAENIGYGLRFRDPPAGTSRPDRIRELLDLVDMSGMGRREPSALSGGQQQRVALARALAPGPELLLLDEPLSALDARLRERLRVTVRDIQQELGITTVYVTHDQAEALAISDRVAVMNDGSIDQIAPPETIYRKPASRFVAEFVGNNNLLDGKIENSTPPVATVDGQTFPLPSTDGLKIGDPVTISIRPEAFSVDTGKKTITATVESVEFLGETYRLHCDWQGRSLCVQADQRYSPTDDIRLNIDSNDVYRIKH